MTRGGLVPFSVELWMMCFQMVLRHCTKEYLTNEYNYKQDRRDHREGMRRDTERIHR